MCMVYLSHYAAAWKEEGGEEEEEGAAAVAAMAAAEAEALPSVSEALIRLYFHLENCELCIDGSELYMTQLSGLVGESRKARAYALACLNLAEKSASNNGARGRGKGKGGRDLVAAFATEEGRRRERQKRLGTFGDQHLLELLYKQKFAEFLADFRNEIAHDYEVITAFTGDAR